MLTFTSMSSPEEALAIMQDEKETQSAIKAYTALVPKLNLASAKLLKSRTDLQDDADELETVEQESNYLRSR